MDIKIVEMNIKIVQIDIEPINFEHDHFFLLLSAQISIGHVPQRMAPIACASRIARTRYGRSTFSPLACPSHSAWPRNELDLT